MFRVRALKGRISQLVPIKFKPVFFLKIKKRLETPVIMNRQPTAAGALVTGRNHETVQVDVISKNSQETFVFENIFERLWKEFIFFHRHRLTRNAGNHQALFGGAPGAGPGMRFGVLSFIKNSVLAVPRHGVCRADRYNGQRRMSSLRIDRPAGLWTST